MESCHTVPLRHFSFASLAETLSAVTLCGLLDKAHFILSSTKSTHVPLYCLVMSLSKVAKRPRVDSPLIAVVEKTSPGHRLSTCTINDLNNDALIHIFEYFPLQKIITRFRQVCTRWNDAVGVICASKRSLKIVDNRFLGSQLTLWPPEHYNRLRFKPVGHDNDLILSGKFMKYEHCEDCENEDSMGYRMLHRLFPQIQSLLLEDYFNVPNLDELLAGWPDLVTLSLYGGVSLRHSSKMGLKRQLYRALERLSQLHHLDLLCDGILGVPKGLEVISGILSNLEHFSVRILNKSIKDYFFSALSSNCTSLHFEGFRQGHPLTTYLKPEVFQSVTHLGFTKVQLTEEHVNLIGDHFVNCTDLTLEWAKEKVSKQISLVDLIRPLSKLTRLSVLRLKFPYPLLRNFQESLKQTPSSTSCPSVRQLTIQVAMGKKLGKAVQTRPFYAILAGAFPKLEDLSIYTTDCNKTVADYEVERSMRPRLLAYTEELWSKPLGRFNVEEPLEPFGRHKEKYLAQHGTKRSYRRHRSDSVGDQAAGDN